jgi:hypothetical protein
MTLDLDAINHAFDKFWIELPPRKPSHPKFESYKSFLKAVKDGAKVEDIISAARQWRINEQAIKNEGTEFVAMASTWLNKKRFLDFPPVAEQVRESTDAFMASKGYSWNGERWVNGQSA